MMLKYIRKQISRAGIGGNTRFYRLRDRIFTGHLSLGPICVYGANAMHYALEVETPWGYLMAHPTTGERDEWRWYVFLSPNGTPQHATWGTGPGFREYRR